MMNGIGLIASHVFPECREIEVDGKIHLKLTTHEELVYPKRIQQIANSWSVQHKCAKEILLKFKLFKLDQFGVEILQKKILKTIEKSLIQLPPVETKRPKSVNKESIELKSERLFKSAVKADAEAENEDVYLFIGETGSGKSTSMNYISGCKMEEYSDPDIGDGIPFIIARKPICKIGMKGTCSTTSECQVVKDTRNLMTYVDCQGKDDTRGPSFEIYNIFSLIEVIKKAKSVRGCNVFLEWSAISSGNGNGVETTLRYLSKLLKDFSLHKSAVLFAITKLDNSKITSVSIRERLKKKIADLIETYENEEPEFSAFCQQILDSEILDNVYGERVVIVNPLKPYSREILIAEMRKFVPSKTKDFGYAVSDKVKRAFAETKESYQVHARNLVSNLMTQLENKWKTAIVTCTIEDFKTWMENLQKWEGDLQNPTIKHFAESAPYTGTDPELTVQLQKCLRYWDMMIELGSPSKHSFDELLFTDLLKAKTKLQEMYVQTEKLYYNAMYTKIETDLKECLYTYAGRMRVEELKRTPNFSIIDNCEPPQLFQITQDLFAAFQKTFPYADKFFTILEKAKKKDVLKAFLKDTLLKPINSAVQAWGQGTFIQITTNTSAVAFSEIWKDIDHSLDKAMNISIQVKSPNSKIYLDQDMFYTGKTITIQADQIIIAKNMKSHLKQGALVLRGEFKGEYAASQEAVSFSEKMSVSIKTPLSWRWI